MDVGKGHFVVAAITSASSCLASAVITATVAIVDPAETSNALIVSGIVAALGLWRARQIAAPKVPGDDDDGEPSVAQDPTQRRIDAVLDMVRWETITADEANDMIANLRQHPLPGPPPPYGTPKET
jgi:hypothetical protein